MVFFVDPGRTEPLVLQPGEQLGSLVLAEVRGNTVKLAIDFANCIRVVRGELPQDFVSVPASTQEQVSASPSRDSRKE